MSSNVETYKNKIINYLLAGVLSIIASLVLIILFALCIKWFSLSDSVIVPVNLCIKAVSIFLGMFIIMKEKSKGLIKGALFGAVYSVLAFIIFSILKGTFTLGIGLVLDLLFCLTVGSIIGIILVNIKK